MDKFNNIKVKTAKDYNIDERDQIPENPVNREKEEQNLREHRENIIAKERVLENIIAKERVLARLTSKEYVRKLRQDFENQDYTLDSYVERLADEIRIAGDRREME